MKSVRVSLDHDDDALSPIHEGICTSPEIDREIILGGQAVDGVETITSFVYGERPAYESVLDGLERIREYDITPAEGGFFLYLRRELGPDGLSLLNALAQDTVVVVPPIEVRSDRTIRLTIVGHPTDLTAILEAQSDGIAADVLWVSDSVTAADPPVSDRQHAALEAAWAVGYYDVPRRNGIEAIADELECAVSTASELVRRGEANVIGRMLESDP
ncbi:helix-turn-helix domain-containing protein [Natrarchaeobius chitinivorans]|uniref:Bacterio-opsin activator n=1 Tax=Natrarchaeobius chitinivorans TaxID=1679083 RepID=A0A3N6MJZ9_NATCH|nr:helix-turn-helix domain-containing protein [Natrarchaeobius chitinivorans]RQG94576.1 bacterio-opsin activator [Natrarchaeobius chitinivorans]